MVGKQYFAGIDAGSRTTKTVILRDDGFFVNAIIPTGVNVGLTAERVLEEAMEKLSISHKDIACLVGTGYGRVALKFADKTITELTCHSLGAHWLNPELRMVIDVGGQDSKVIHLDDNGNMIDFAMNDKCAAGTGKFFEMVARTLEMELQELSSIHEKATTPSEINSMCVVFVESEIISLLARGKPAADIVAGVNKAFATRIGNMAKRLGMKEKLVLTGGVAKNRGFSSALSGYLGRPFTTIDIDPQLNGALGAAVLAEKTLKPLAV